MNNETKINKVLRNDFEYKLQIEKKKWTSYISREYSYNHEYPSMTDQIRLSFCEDIFRRSYFEGRVLYHLTITYKPYSDRTYTEKDVNVFFKTFYVKYFLSKLLNTRNIHTEKNKYIQPITFTFLHEHENGKFYKRNINGTFEFPLRLHHHSILCVHPDTLDYFENLSEENFIPTDTKYTSKIMTSHIRPCETTTLLYSSSLMKKYPDFMSFPDTFKRNRYKQRKTPIMSNNSFRDFN